MTTKNFFIFQALVSLVYGIQLLFVPSMLVSVFTSQTLEVTSVLDVISRGYGTLLTAVGIAYWTARDAGASIARRSMLLMPAIGNTLVTIVHIRAILQGTENALGWTTVLITAVLAVWSGLLWSKDAAATNLS